MSSNEIRKRFLSFFEKRGHAIISSASLVPSDYAETDSSVLFTTAGMQPLVPYLLGEAHPKGRRLVNIQKCVRMQDIDEVGDKTHDTFFEMLGNWSLGDSKAPDGIGAGYFKEDAIKWSYEFLTNPVDGPEGDRGLGLDPHRLYITCFSGDEDAPKDTESAKIWMSVGIPESRVYFFGKEENWWSPGENGPSGPDTEIFYDVTGAVGDLKNEEEFKRADNKQEIVELWNDVFMEYEKKDGRVIGKLKQKNVDTGAGLERLAMVIQEKDNIFETDLFFPLVTAIKESSNTADERVIRIVADHMRTAVFMIADGVEPSNTDRGYVLRRLLRRAQYYFNNVLGGGVSTLVLAQSVLKIYRDTDYTFDIKVIEDVITKEEARFRTTLEKGLKKFEKLRRNISGEAAFTLFSTYGFPLELTLELAGERGMTVDADGFRREFEKHQELSRKGAEQKFKGGLADTSGKTVMLHTATHLLLAGLRKHLREHVHQAGSNITAERTRFDFTHPEKVDRETLDKVESYVNEAIQAGARVIIEKMPKEKAQKSGVEGSFWEKYPDMVHVYKIVDSKGIVYSRELCGGPHVENTGAIEGTFKIVKEEAAAAGIRRIKATLT